MFCVCIPARAPSCKSLFPALQDLYYDALCDNFLASVVFFCSVLCACALSFTLCARMCTKMHITFIYVRRICPCIWTDHACIPDLYIVPGLRTLRNSCHAFPSIRMGAATDCNTTLPWGLTKSVACRYVYVYVRLNACVCIYTREPQRTATLCSHCAGRQDCMPADTRSKKCMQGNTSDSDPAILISDDQTNPCR
jgi:hypothetical protein